MTSYLTSEPRSRWRYFSFSFSFLFLSLSWFFIPPSASILFPFLPYSVLLSPSFIFPLITLLWMASTWKFVLSWKTCIHYYSSCSAQVGAICFFLWWQFYLYCVLHWYFWATLHPNPHPCHNACVWYGLGGNTFCEKENVPQSCLRNSSWHAGWVTTVCPASQNNLLWHLIGTMSPEEWHLREFKSLV